jgi:succinyl-CoA synthetase alpha subunit
MDEPNAVRRFNSGDDACMGILIDERSRILVQGITGREGGFHAKSCADYGTNVVAGVTPGRGGQTAEGNIPVFDSVEEAVRETGANVSLIFVPARAAMDAVVEAADAHIQLVICISEGIPVLDMVKLDRYLDNKGVRLIGPNCPGLINPGAACKVGIMPGSIHLPGRTGVVSRSGTLTYEAVAQLTDLGIGQSSCIGIGGDPIIGTDFVDVLRLFDADPETDQVVLIGEIGGAMEQYAAAYIKEEFSKPICALIVGATAPSGKRMGHAGAIITGDSGRAESKVKALRDAGAAIVPTPADIGVTLKSLIESNQG